MELRPYQREAVTASVQALKQGLNPAIQLPTGAGKSLVIAHLASKFEAKGGRMIVLTHVKELVEQNENTLNRYSPSTRTGVVCAGLNRDDWKEPIVFASIQSVFKRGKEFKELGLDIVVIDEAHMVPPDGEGLMYKRFLQDADVRRIGLSATPWRLDGGAIYGDDKPFDVLAYQLPPSELVEDGYLSPLKGVETEWQMSTTGLAKTAGDYVMSKVADRINEDDWVGEAIDNALKHLNGRKHILVFCPTVATAKETAERLDKKGETSGFVCADSKDRDEQLSSWKAGEVRFMCNVDILTTGFDFPALDAIICLRPTTSSALWVQMLGRGMRLAAGKTDCLILDYVGNLARLGGVGTMESWSKEKQGKLEPVEKDEVERKAKPQRTVRDLALQSIDPMLDRATGLLVHVKKCSFVVRPSGRKPGKSILLAVYDCETDQGISVDVTQFVCVEYEGGARWHAEQWAKRRGYTNGPAFPREAHKARVECYALPIPRRLQVRRQDGHMNVLREFF
tara:strand:- start:6124 stop:7650 length:1527 start_codon:yes stop_codon:yes gene_type:complete